MAGEPENQLPGTPGAPPPSPREAAPPPKVKTFQCPGCGSPLTVRGMQQTEAIACGACGSVIDLTDETFKIISTYQSKIKHQPLIPLGTRGKVRGETYEVIGYLRRRIVVEGVPYEWSEYLLFNPFKGFRWLTEYNGHWNFVKTTANLPQPVTIRGRAGMNYLGTDFLQFQSAEAKVSYVVGEFYWRVEVGETAQVVDYVSPPLVLSREKTDAEETWSIGEYTDPETLWTGFQLKTSPPVRIGVASNQPSPFSGRSSNLMKRMLIFLAAALFLQIFISVISRNRLVYENDFRFDKTSAEKSLVTDVFEIPGRTSNVVVRSRADVNNSWIFLSMALINEETSTAYDFGREISYYHGVEGGESWSEGNVKDEATLPSIPAGRYYLRIEPESESPAVYYHIQVCRDVPRWSYLFITMGLLLVLPVWHWIRGRSFEASRWSESDFPLGGRSSGSSDDD